MSSFRWPWVSRLALDQCEARVVDLQRELAGARAALRQQTHGHERTIARFTRLLSAERQAAEKPRTPLSMTERLKKRVEDRYRDVDPEDNVKLLQLAALETGSDNMRRNLIRAGEIKRLIETHRVSAGPGSVVGLPPEVQRQIDQAEAEGRRTAKGVA